MLMDIIAAMYEPAAADSRTDPRYRDAGASPGMLPMQSPQQPPVLSVRSTADEHEKARASSIGSKAGRSAAPKTSVAAETTDPQSTPPPPPPPDWRLLDVQVHMIHIYANLYHNSNGISACEIVQFRYISLTIAGLVAGVRGPARERHDPAPAACGGECCELGACRERRVDGHSGSDHQRG
jgi:hypothetical protein